MSNHKLEDFSVGDVVRICEDSEYYSEEGFTGQLPRNVGGTIKGYSDDWIVVHWKYGSNTYEPKDLVIISKAGEGKMFDKNNFKMLNEDMTQEEYEKVCKYLHENYEGYKSSAWPLNGERTYFHYTSVENGFRDSHDASWFEDEPEIEEITFEQFSKAFLEVSEDVSPDPSVEDTPNPVETITIDLPNVKTVEVPFTLTWKSFTFDLQDKDEQEVIELWKAVKVIEENLK